MLIHDIDIYQKQSIKQRKYVHSLIQMLLVKGYLNISSAIAQRELGRNYKNILKEFTHVVSSYSIGNKCRTYMLRKDIQVFDHSTKEERNARNNASYMKFDKSALDVALNNLSANKKTSAMSYLNKIYASNNLSEMTYKIDDEHGGRQTNAFGCLPKEIRKLAIINGRGSFGVDLKSSQPRTTVIELGLDTMSQKDAIRFVKLVNNGELYYLISKDLNISYEDAKAAYNAAINSSLSENTWAERFDEKQAAINKAKVSEYMFDHFPTVYDAAMAHKKKFGKKMIGKHIMAMEARAVFETMKAHKDVHIIPVYDQIYIFADKETAETVIDTFYNNVKKYMGWKDISKEEAFRIEDNNIQEAGFVFENKEQEEGNKEQRAIILVSKAKSPKMLAYLQRKTIHKWFDFGPIPIRI